MAADEGEAGGKRVIKRYTNRKLYDTRASRYVTLTEIGALVRRGEEVQIIDNQTKEDKTEVTLALILSEDVKAAPRAVPLGALRALVQERGERLLSTLREGPIGRLLPGSDAPVPAPVVEWAPPEDAPIAEPPLPAPQAVEPERPSAKGRLSELVESSRHTLDQLQVTLDERVQAVVPGLGLIRSLRAEVAQLSRRVDAIEAMLGIPPDEPREPGTTP